MNELSQEDFYYTPEGFLVFTEAYHLKRGFCCESGCRHCPYRKTEIDNQKAKIETEE